MLMKLSFLCSLLISSFSYASDDNTDFQQQDFMYESVDSNQTFSYYFIDQKTGVYIGHDRINPLGYKQDKITIIPFEYKREGNKFKLWFVPRKTLGCSLYGMWYQKDLQQKHLFGENDRELTSLRIPLKEADAVEGEFDHDKMKFKNGNIFFKSMRYKFEEVFNCNDKKNYTKI